MSRREASAIGGEPPRPLGFDDYDLRLGDMMRGERATLGKSLLDVQRELKIKATYIAAIENADPSAFDTPGFIAGYVRSYARYLGMDSEWAFRKFCEEANFEKVHGMSAEASGARSAGVSRNAVAGVRRKDPFADPETPFIPRGTAVFSGFEPAALGAVLVLVLLIGGVAYGGWTVLQEIQRVKFAPVEQAPGVVVALDPLAPSEEAVATAGEAAGVSVPPPDSFRRLYRPEALETPVFVARDGPISTLDPDETGVLAATAAPDSLPERGASAKAPSLPFASLALTGNDREQRGMVANGNTLSAPQVIEERTVKVLEDPAAPVAIIATRPAWMQVKTADGTVILEKILDAGERYVVPVSEHPPVLRTGYAGAVYFAVNGQTYGPAGEGPKVAKNIVLGPEELKEAFTVARLEDHPELAKVVAELTQE